MRLALLAVVIALCLWIGDQTLYQSYYSKLLMVKADRIAQDARYQIKRWL